jgi:hypothetical protein
MIFRGLRILTFESSFVLGVSNENIFFNSRFKFRLEFVWYVNKDYATKNFF